MYIVRNDSPRILHFRAPRDCVVPDFILARLSLFNSCSMSVSCPEYDISSSSLIREEQSLKRFGSTLRWKKIYFLSERIMVFNAQEWDFRIFRQWKICPDLGSFSQIFIRLTWSFRMEGHEIRSPDWFVFFNVMHLSLVQTVLYKQHYIKHNAIKLTFACLAAIFGGSFWRQNGGLWFVYQN